VGEAKYPRLLYWADLPVSATHAGAMLMHRLLKGWPADRLIVVTPGAVNGCDLPGVSKVEPPPSRWSFLYRTRFSRIWMTLTGLRILWRARLTRGNPPKWLRQAIKEFQPEAVLTAGVAGAWIPAAAYARREKIPLHVIVHDDHHYANFWTDGLRPYGEKLFAKAYRQAASRFCVSRPMERLYRERFGVDGDVLLPLRGSDSVFYGEPGPRTRPSTGAQVFYAGSLSGEGFRALDEIAGALAAKGHRLIVYSPSAPSGGFKTRHLELRPPIPSAELVAKLHEEADVLLLFTDFSAASREGMQTLFPSKLVDYTAAAVPILVLAPPDASIVDYLQDRPHAAQLVTELDSQRVVRAVDKVCGDGALWQRLAEGAVAAGIKDFDYEKGFESFRLALQRGRMVEDGAAKLRTKSQRDQETKRLPEVG